MTDGMPEAGGQPFSICQASHAADASHDAE